MYIYRYTDLYRYIDLYLCCKISSFTGMGFNLKQIITPFFFTLLNFPLFSMVQSLNSIAFGKKNVHARIC